MNPHGSNPTPAPGGTPADPTVTRLLGELQAGHGSAAERLLPLVYGELRRLAQTYLASERTGHTLQATALVHEAYLKLVDQKTTQLQGRDHFFAVAARAMRQILVDHARGRGRDKRGGGAKRIELDEAIVLHDGSSVQSPGAASPDSQIIFLDDSLAALAKLDERQARMVECFYFGGLSSAQIGSAFGVSERTVQLELSHARAWLKERMT